MIYPERSLRYALVVFVIRNLQFSYLESPAIVKKALTTRNKAT